MPTQRVRAKTSAHAQPKISLYFPPYQLEADRFGKAIFLRRNERLSL